MRRLNPYRWVKPNPVRVHVDNLPSTLLLPIQQTLVQDYGTPRSERQRTSALVLPADTTRTKTRHYHSKSLTALQKLFTGEVQGNDVPLATLWHARDDTDATAGTNTEDEATDRYLYLCVLTFFFVFPLAQVIVH
jgi:voltage-dependent calcium channel